MKKRKMLAKISVISVLIALGFFLIFFGVYSVVFSQKIYAREYIGETNFGGKTKNQTKEILQQKTKEFLDQEIVLIYQNEKGENKNYNLKPSDLGLQYNVDATADELWKYGRGDNIFVSFWQQLKSVFQKNQFSSEYTISEDSINKKISEIALEVDDPEKDFSLIYQNGNFILLTDRKEGSRIDQSEIKQAISHQISVVSHEEINFKSKVYKPQINEVNARKRLEEANGILKAGQLTLQFEDQKHVADVNTIASFISSRPKSDDLEIIFNEEKIKTFVQNLSGAINVTPQNATLSVKDGKATVFSTARTGKTLDSVQTIVDIENALTARLPEKTGSANPSVIDLKVDVKKPEITDDAISSLGIVELIASGTTDFKNSPTNRVNNITVGMTAVNGSLLKPGEEFSTLKKLGTIDGTTGYLPELVIKNNQTIPEYGGGLCQVSTTLFRVALNAGLKITERYNHSYRVSYYEPPIGMDATIYDPAPDFKFVNNYGSHLLIQGYIKGSKITFEIYGTKDSRTVSIGNAEGYDYVNPPATEEIPSPTLPVGQRQQVQKPHQGASAKFHYKVERNGEILQEKDFISKYIALPEKWLVGAAATPPPAPETTPTAPLNDPAPQPAPATEPTPAA